MEETKVKEPWKMTREKYREVGSKLYNKFGNAWYVNSPFFKYSENVPHAYFEESIKKFPNNTSNEMHYRVIKRALSEDKPVPIEVLRQYPDLAKKYERI